MSLRGSIQALTETHLKMGPAGKPVRAPSLLSELREAIHPSQAGGVSGGSKLRIPIDAKSMSLMQDIDREARQHQREMGWDDRGTLEAVMRSWVALPEGDEWAAFLEHVTLDWVDRITDLLEPKRPWKPNAPCPHCGERFAGDDRAQVLAVYFRDGDGEALHPSEWRMVCTSCGMEWTGDDLGAIAYAMSAA